MKTNASRIEFYTRKTAQHFTIPMGKRNPYRYGRLIYYQEALNKRLIEGDKRLQRRYNWF